MRRSPSGGPEVAVKAPPAPYPTVDARGGLALVDAKAGSSGRVQWVGDCGSRRCWRRRPWLRSRRPTWSRLDVGRNEGLRRGGPGADEARRSGSRLRRQGAGRIFLSLPAPDASGVAGRYLYMTALETGLGSAPVGLDRDAPSEARILVFRRVGKKVLAEIENPKFRATGAPAAEQDAARNSFAFSTLWAGEVAAEEPDGRILVEISSFLIRDSMRVADALARAGEGSWRLSPDLTVADPSASRRSPRTSSSPPARPSSARSPGPRSTTSPPTRSRSP